MGGKHSIPPHPYDFKYKIRILVAGYNHRGGTFPEKQINKFVYNDYREGGNIAVPLDLVTVPIDDKRVNLDIKDISSMMNAVSVYEKILCMELTRFPLVGLLLVYNPTVQYSFDKTKEIVDVELPRLLQKASHGATRRVAVVLVGDESQYELGRKKEVSYCTAREFGDERGIPVVEVCGKEGVNVVLAFLTLAGEVLHLNRQQTQSTK